MAPSHSSRLAGVAFIFLFTTLLTAVATAAYAQGSISGTVTSSTTGLGLPGTVMEFYDFNSNGEAPAFTTVVDGSGHYSQNLPASTYGVFAKNILGYVNEVYNNVQCSAICDLDTVTPLVVTNAAITGIDFALDPGGRISGTVTDSGTGLPIAGVTIPILGSVGDIFPFTFATSDVNGNYLSDAGSVTGNVFAVTGNILGYQNEGWDNVKCPFCDNAVATPIPVTAGVTTTAINFALDPGGSISGTVRDASLNPVANVQVSILDANGDVVEGAGTDGAGLYRSGGLPTGTYYAVTEDNAGLVDVIYNGVPCPGRFCEHTIGTPIAVTLPATVTGIDFVLPAGGTITGTVTNANGGAPLEDIFVAFSDPSGAFVAGRNTDSDGHYSSHNLPPGIYYANVFSPPGFLQQLYNNLTCTPSCNITSGTPIIVTAGAATGNINFALTATGLVGTISGTVTDASLVPINNVQVQVFNANGTQIGSNNTTAQGVYTVPNLPVGSYYVRTNTGGGFINQLHNGVICLQCQVTTSGGTLVPVTNGGTSTINFVLSAGGRISGTITNAAGGAAIQSVGVQVFSSAGVQVGTFNSSASGGYTTAGLPAGTYYLRTTNTLGFVNELYNNGLCPVTGCTPTTGTPVVVVGTGTTTGRNFALVAGGRISGTVTSAVGGTPIGFMQVQIFNANGFQLGTVNTDASGNYTTQALPAGPYFLRTSNAQGFSDEVYDNVACVVQCGVTSGTPVNVTAGLITSGRNFALAPGGSVAGTVTDAATTGPLGSVTVGLYTAAGVLAKAASTNANGVYAVSGVTPGTYFARTFVQGGQNYLDELYSEMACAPACTVTTGTPIVVPGPVAANGRNFTLSAGGGAISGTVRDATTSATLSGVRVEVYQSNGTMAKGAATNASGVYTLSGLPAGTYYLRTAILTGLSYVDELYNNLPCFPTCTVTAGAGVVVVNGATTSNIDFSLDSNLVQNGRFDAGTSLWKTFAAPNTSHMVSSVVNGVFNWHRIVQPPATPVSQATIFFETGQSFAAGEPLLAQFDLANTAAVVKVARILLVSDAGFSDFDACTFALPPDGVMRTYQMRGRTTAAWTNATIYFYATTAFTAIEPGNLQLDNVSLRKGSPGQSVTKTECVDPLAPVPGVGAPSGNALTNGDFSSGALAPGWVSSGAITVRNPMVGGVAEFTRPTGFPPAVVLQQTAPDIPANTLMTLTLDLGNSSPVRKRALVLVHDSDFSSFVACAWWLAPGQPLGTYTMRLWNSELWTDPTVAVYPSTVGVQEWTRLDNVSFQLTPAASTPGTACVDPGGSRPETDSGPAETLFTSLVDRGFAAGESSQPDGTGGHGFSVSDGSAWRETADGWEAIATSSETSILGRTDTLDLRGATGARLTFESWLSTLGSRGEVQVTVDGVTWTTVAEVAASDTWQPVDVDLAEFMNEVITLRFVFSGVSPADGATFDIWRLRDVDVTVERPIVSAGARSLPRSIAVAAPARWRLPARKTVSRTP